MKQDYSLNEEWLDRDEMIAELEELGFHYHWEKHSDASVYHIYNKTLAKIEADKEKAKQAKELEQEFANLKQIEKCEICGQQLNDNGECPVCDLGDEDCLKEDVEKHDKLNDKLWNKDNTLKEEVKEKLNLIIEEFLDGLKENDISIDLADAIICGSNCSYNYNKDSDLDLHLIAKHIDAPENLYEKIYSAYRSLFDKKLDIEFYGIPIEIFVENEDTPGVYNGIYSIIQDKWLQEPVAEDIPEIDKEALDKSVKEWEDRYNEIVDNSEEKLDESLHEDINTTESSYKKGVNNKTLKEVLLSIAKIIVPEQVENTVYEVHHLDYNNTNNDVENISIMPVSAHRSFHKKASGLSRQDKDNLFKEYYDECIQVGNLLLAYIHQTGHEAEKEQIKEALTEDVNTAKSIIADQIRGEWEAIRNYQKAADDLKDLGDFKDVMDILNSISEEEEVHVGELEKAQSLIDNNLLDNIEDGRNEAEEDLAEKEASVDESLELKESSITFKQITLPNNYYLECRWDKYNGYEVCGGFISKDQVVKDDFHKSYPTKEAALKAFERYAKIKNESLTEDANIEEALNWAEQEAKMTAWHNGTRGANIKQMSGYKLEVNARICKQKGYTRELRELENEAKARGIVLSTMIKELPVAYDINFSVSRLEDVKNNLTNAKKLIELAQATGHEEIAAIYLVFALVLNEGVLATAIKDELVALGYSLQNIKDFINRCTSNQKIMDRIVQLINGNIPLYEGKLFGQTNTEAQKFMEDQIEYWDSYQLKNHPQSGGLNMFNITNYLEQKIIPAVKKKFPNLQKADIIKNLKSISPLIKNQANFNIMDKRVFESLDEAVENKQLDEIEQYLTDIYEMRKQGLSQDGQYGIENLTFKEIRNKGYLDNLKDLRNKLISKELSLESLEESKNICESVYEVTYHDGPNSNRKTKITIEANSDKEAENIIYHRPESKQYSNVTWGLKQSDSNGVYIYDIVFNFEYYFNGKPDNNRPNEERKLIKATSERQAKKYYMNNYYGKFSNSLRVGNHNNLAEHPSDRGQSMRCGKIIEIEQFAPASDPNWVNRTDIESAIALEEDTVKNSKGKWVNKGEDGTHGEFKTKKAADAQRRAMFANGYHEGLQEEQNNLILTNSELQEMLIKEFGTLSNAADSDATYILRDGTILNTKGKRDINAQHENVAKYLSRVLKINDMDENNGSRTMVVKLGAVRVTGWIPGIYIPDIKMTEEQQQALEEFIRSPKTEINEDHCLMVSNYAGDQFSEYPKKLPADIVKDLMEYYRTGQLVDYSTFGWDDLYERLDERKRYDYKNEISRITHNQAIIQDNGLFNIYNIKEDNIDRIISLLRRLDYIEWVQKTAGKYDFSHPQFMGPQKRYYNITGKIKEEQN